MFEPWKPPLDADYTAGPTIALSDFQISTAISYRPCGIALQRSDLYPMAQVHVASR
jgi:hypothetical protein